MLHLGWTVVAAVLAAGTLAALSQEPSQKPSAQISLALQMREYDRALALIDARLAADPPDAEREYLLFQSGLALSYAGRHADAVARFEQQLAKYPAGLWADKARFRKAAVHVEMREFETAEQIYAELVRVLVGDDRKAQVAGVYIKFADEYFKPADPLVRPDFARARSFYQRALELEPGEPLRDHLIVREADCAREMGDLGAAERRYRDYLLQFDPAYRAARATRGVPAGWPAPAGAPGANRAHARLELGRVLLAQGTFGEARRELQDLLAFLRAGDPDRVATAETWIEAKVLLARTHEFPEPSDEHALAMGTAELEELIAAYPNHLKAVEALYDLARANLDLSRHDAARKACERLLQRDWTAAGLGDDVRKRGAGLAQEALFAIGQIQAAQQKYEDAIQTWSRYVAMYPAGPHWTEAQRAIVDAEFQIGAALYEKEVFQEARDSWTRFLELHPLDERAPAIMHAFGVMAYRTAEKKAKEGAEADWQAPITAWRALLSKFPQSERAGHAQFMIGQICETRLHELEQALKEYEKLTWSQWQAAAQERIAEMRATRLLVKTERTWRTSEPATIRVDVRNVDRLRISLYRIDMADYFRKSHTHGGIESLDLFLIDPDQTLDVDVEGYADYKPCTQEIELPVDGAGVYAVNVCTEPSTVTQADGRAREKIEATTLVIRSDVDVILKTSRRQVFVFAQDMLRQAPAADVDILVSDGQKIILTGRTGPDGVWQGRSDDLQSRDQIAVLASRAGHVAGNALELRGLAFSRGLEPRGYIYTDRPVYRPGDAVNIRGVLREVKGGVYVVPSQPDDPRLRWKLDVVDAKGRVLTTEELTFNEYGSFATQYRVAEDGPVGGYTLIARRPEGPAFSGTFLVQTYVLPKAVLRFKLDEHVVLRGEAITGTIELRYHYGEPIADRVVEYALEDHMTGDKLARSGTTDRDGCIKFTFETGLLAEETWLMLTAQQADLNLETSESVEVAVRAFAAEVTTPRALYLSDEPVEVTIRTKDRRDKPVAQAMTLVVSRVTRDRGRWAESEVGRYDVQTSADTGKGRTTIRLSDGGDYVLRAEGKDRFGHLVEDSLPLQISDDKDRVRLRLFSDRQHYEVGDTLALDVHSRIGDDAKETYLALVTFEGEEIIGYRTVRLAPGHNPLDLKIDHEHFPNFAVGVACMAGNGFHEASREFTVARQLEIRLFTDKQTYQPRDEMQVRIEVTDQQGRPVQAEVGLAMIDDALLARFADPVPNIVWFFEHAARRDAALRTETSCRFSYVGRTRDMVTELLAEARRFEETRGRGGYPGAGEIDGDGEYEFSIAENSMPYHFVLQGEGTVAHDLDVLDPRQMAFGGSATDATGRQSPPGTSHSYVRSVEPSRAAGGGGGAPRMFQAMRAASGGNQQQAVGETMHSFAGTRVRGLFGGGQSLDDIDLYIDAAGLDDLGQLSGRARQDVYLAGKRVQRAFDEKMSSLVIATDPADVARVAALLNDVIRNAPPRSFFPEVAYWNPRIVTDERGEATLTIVVPDSSTTWKLVARGVTPETLCGHAEAQVVSRHAFFVEVLSPVAYIEGDVFVPRVAVHCVEPVEGEIEVELVARPRDEKASPADELVRQTQRVRADGAGVHELTFDTLTLASAGDYLLEASARILGEDGRQDRVAQRIAVAPWGMRVEAHAAGIGRDADFVEIELPEQEAGRAYHDMQLTVAVGPGMQRWLVEEALEQGPRWVFIEDYLAESRLVPPRTNADTASDLLAALYAADYVRSREPDNSADLRLLHERGAGLIAQLLASQQSDGGWAWCGAQKESDPWTTGYAAWALGKARRGGHPVADDAVSSLAAYLKRVHADAQPVQTELKAVALHGLSWLEAVDFAHVNRLYRNRETLSAPALAHVALTFTRMDRDAMAADLLRVLDERMRETTLRGRTCRVLPVDTNSAWMTSELEVTALALLAQLAVDPRAGSVEPVVAYLAGTARADGWRPRKARGAVLAALATYYAGAQAQAAAYEVVVKVNDQTPQVMRSTDRGSLRIDLSGAQLRSGKQRVDFGFSGRGEYAYAISLSGFARGYADTTPNQYRVLRAYDRHVAPPPLEYRGRQVMPGFSIAADYKWFTNAARHLPVGAVATVGMTLSRIERTGTRPEERHYVVVKERVPAGFRLLPDTVRGEFQAYDYADNVLTLYYGSKQSLGALTYDMVAVTPGTYRLPPTIVRSLYRPEIVAINKPEQTLTVLSRGAPSPDPYNHTPDELYALGRLHFEDGDYDPAARYLKELIAGEWLLRDEPYRESVHMLLRAALARADAGAIVDNFEVLKERYPDLVIPFEQIVQVADAYARTEQFERAYLVYRATADASFVREAKVAAALQGEGRFLDSVDFMRSLWRVYPDTPQVESVYFALSQAVYAQADRAGSVRPRGGVTRERSYVTRAELIREAMFLIEHFLSLYPESPIADEAVYSLGNAYLDLEDFRGALGAMEQFIALYPGSKWVDRYRYIQALAHFSLGDFEKARQTAEIVASAKYRDEQGIERESPNKWLALYIIGQIHHARGQTAQAIEYYKKVREHFSDASDAVGAFERRFVRLPEVTIFHPDADGWRESEEWARALRAARRTPEPDGVAAERYRHPFVQLDYRNIKNAVLQVYRVDLMKLALVEKNLTQITEVNLAGIRPLLEKEMELGEGLDYVDKTLKVEFDALTEQDAGSDGAYLVICRGDDLYASGLVLVTPLALEVQEDLASQRTRVTVVDAITRQGLRDVHVKVIGMGMSEFVSGGTDLRGVFIADGVRGFPTAVARDPSGRFAFYRSETAVAMAGLEPMLRKAEAEATPQERLKADYLSNLQVENRELQRGNVLIIEDLYQQTQKGVEVKKSH